MPFVRYFIREKPYYLVEVTWRASAKTIYGFALAMLGMLYLAVILAQIEAAFKAQTLPSPSLVFWSALWLSPGGVALLSTWYLWVKPQVKPPAIWAFFAPAYALSGWLVLAGPAWLREKVAGPWALVAASEGSPVSASIWLAALIVVFGGTVFLSTLMPPDKDRSHSS